MGAMSLTDDQEGSTQITDPRLEASLAAVRKLVTQNLDRISDVLARRAACEDCGRLELEDLLLIPAVGYREAGNFDAAREWCALIATRVFTTSMRGAQSKIYLECGLIGHAEMTATGDAPDRYASAPHTCHALERFNQALYLAGDGEDGESLKVRVSVLAARADLLLEMSGATDALAGYKDALNLLHGAAPLDPPLHSLRVRCARALRSCEDMLESGEGTAEEEEPPTFLPPSDEFTLPGDGIPHDPFELDSDDGED